ncbi:MAG: hypothetical protein HKP41_22545 [Desulfobacterales bacterium]|nr:hypothetical protein [Deltaproteobacteria bacterium]NNK97143.1 hypothetical protein [Desulfobacterales bacterium]
MESFVAQWPIAQDSSRRIFVELRNFLLKQAATTLSFKPRPEVSYSLRARHLNQLGKPLFVMIDVIDHEPRWLSVCFYDQMVTDPEDWGDCVPGGLLGEDGLCFDVEGESEELLAYLKERISEAHNAASVDIL